MSSEVYDGPSQDEQAKQKRLEAEWANVGLCGGMFRPLYGSSYANHSDAHNVPDSPALHAVNEADWQPHNRCCL